MASKKSDTKETKKVVKKTTTKKVTPKKVVKKAAPKKVVKKAAPKKVVEKTLPKKVEVKEEKVEVKSETLSVESRKYIYFVGLLVLGFILIMTVYDVYTYYSFDVYHTSYLVNTAAVKKENVIKLNDAKDKFKNLKGDYFIYLSYTDDTEVYKLEKKMKKLIDKYKLSDKFYYINVDNEMKEKDSLELINTYLNI